jgi:hypothetical protein
VDGEYVFGQRGSFFHSVLEKGREEEYRGRIRCVVCMR